MQIAIAVYDRFTALDAIGPYAVLSATCPAPRSRSSPRERGPVARRHRAQRRWPTASFDEVTAPDVIVVPGGLITRARWHATATRSSTGCARCTRPRRGRRRCARARSSSAAAGVLDGLDATTHWMALRAAGGARRQPDRPSAWWCGARS